MYFVLSIIVLFLISNNITATTFDNNVLKFSQNRTETSGLFSESFQPYICNGSFGTQFNGSVIIEKEYIFVFPYNKTQLDPARVTVESNTASKSENLQVVVTQRQSIISWQVPLESDSPTGIFTYNRVSRTLCPDDDPDDEESERNIIITLSTESKYPVDFKLWVNNTKEFNIVPSKRYHIQLTPSEPQFFRFTFDTNISSALIHVESPDAPCMTLSIQNNSCPVYETEGTVEYRGLYQTVVSKGGIFLRKEEFPHGMFIVFVTHSTDRDCVSHPTTTQYMSKMVIFQLEKSIDFWDYVIGILAVLVVFTVIYVIAGCFLLWSNRTAPSNAAILIETDCPFPDRGWSSPTVSSIPFSPGELSDDGSNISETEVDILHDTDTSKEVARTKEILFLCDLAQKDSRVLSVKSKLYLWNMVTVAVFYALPVVQLVFSYQQVSIKSGNQDLCYYNFLCSHRLGYLSDFNHIFSNIGYLLFGLLFLGLTWRRQRLNQCISSHLGIPYHFGMFYALGFALCMEGLLSASYHLCPNKSNFQFDTSFMYVIATLTMIKIYQTRHPDITASAYTTFGALAFIIFLCTFGVLNSSEWFYVAFTVAHLWTCLLITAQLYHVGNWKLDCGMFTRFIGACKVDYVNGGLRQCCWPKYPTRMLLLVLANIGNWAMVVLGYYLEFGNFATYMLSLFLANLLMYLVFYIVMKKVCKEKILTLPLIYIILASLFWSGGLYFFYHKSISWKEKPAESRAYNQPCVILNFYDKHDIWHFLSAGALFFSFMVLLTLDDDIVERDRRLISVF